MQSNIEGLIKIKFIVHGCHLYMKNHPNGAVAISKPIAPEVYESVKHAVSSFHVW